MAKMKIGLALGSGAARGLAHIGVIKALRENDISVDIVAGTSIGAVVGLFVAAEKSIEEMLQFAKGFGKKRLAFIVDPSFFRGGGLLKGGKIQQAIEDFVGPCTFLDLKKPFYVVATDLITGAEVVITRGDLFSAVRASFSIPGILSPVKLNNRWLVDGALVAPVPTRVLVENNCDMIIAVNVINEPEKTETISHDRTPGMFSVAMQALSVTQQKIAEPCMMRADIRITPNVNEFDWTDFEHVEKLVDAGYTATIKEVEHIKKVISKKKRFYFLKRLFTKS